MPTETDIALIELNAAKKIMQNEVHANERVLNAVTEAERLIVLKDAKIAELQKALKTYLDAYDSRDVVFVDENTIGQIRNLLQ